MSSPASPIDQPSHTAPSRLVLGLPLLFIFLVSIWLSFARINEGLPFFYREDEAHHFNRVTEMVKEGRFDPRYFHKPSLHFYMRMPVLAASFFWTVSQGNIRSVQDIITRDKFGLSGYAFSASHPGIVKWNRAFSVALGLLTVLLSASIAWMLTGSLYATIGSAAAIAFSPEFITEGSVIGVDPVMTFMCVSCVWFALRVSRPATTKNILICALLSGLAISSKYNAAPVAIVPLLLCLGNGMPSYKHLAVAIGGTLLGFCIATPYLFAHFNLFLDQVAYEVWHYGVAGHAGHMTEPGLPQALFYLDWFTYQALGPLITVFALFGVLLLLHTQFSRTLIFLSFPVLYMLLMISQKANFTRNMLVMIPFIAITGVVTFLFTLEWLRIGHRLKNLITVVCAILALGYPLSRSILERNHVAAAGDTRVHAMSSLRNSSSADAIEIAIAGQLQFPPSFFLQGPFHRFEQQADSLLPAYLTGADLLVTHPGLQLSEQDKSLFPAQSNIQGHDTLERIVRSPSIEIRAPRADASLDEAIIKFVRNSERHRLNILLGETGKKNCSLSTGYIFSEEYCWIQSRTMALQFNDFSSHASTSSDTRIAISFEAMSPWPNNSLSFYILDRESPTPQRIWSQEATLPNNQWHTIQLRVPRAELLKDPVLLVNVPIVRTPKLHGINSDYRALGVAIKNVRLG